MDGGLIVPEHLAEEMRSTRMAAAMEEARLKYQMALAQAYRAGYDLAVKTPRRLQAQLNVGANFWRWYEEQTQGEALDGEA